MMWTIHQHYCIVLCMHACVRVCMYVEVTSSHTHTHTHRRVTWDPHVTSLCPYTWYSLVYTYTSVQLYFLLRTCIHLNNSAIVKSLYHHHTYIHTYIHEWMNKWMVWHSMVCGGPWHLTCLQHKEQEKLKRFLLMCKTGTSWSKQFSVLIYV